LELIESGRGSESRRGDMLATVRSELARLARFVDEILDAESIERGAIPVEKDPISLLPVVRTVVDAFAIEANARRFTIVDAPDLPFVLADGSMTERVLHNLVRNAVSYSTPGSPIQIELSAHEDFVWISVIDKGFGIPADRLGTIFDRFSRAHLKDSQDIYGYGLGLYTCKMLVEAQGGRIWVESEEGRGSRFTLTLPVLPVLEEAL
jgi:signal transduction histidine kinase